MEKHEGCTALPLQTQSQRAGPACGWLEVLASSSFPTTSRFYLGGSHGGSAPVSGFLGSFAEAAQPPWVHLSGRLFRPIDCCSQGAVLLEGPNVSAR